MWKRTAVAVAVACTMTAAVAPTVGADEPPEPPDPIVIIESSGWEIGEFAHHCGWLSCTAYIGNGVTREIVRNYPLSSDAVLAGVVTALCAVVTVATGPGGIACAIAGTTSAAVFRDALRRSGRTRTRCLSIRYILPGIVGPAPVPIGVSANLSNRCPNRED